MSRGGQGSRQNAPSVDPSRLAAYDVLVAVREDDAYANLVLPQLLRERRIEGRDAAFTTELVGGTLRGLRSYDAVIDHLAGRSPDAGVRDALRLGAHQLLGMRVPDHAAVASTVELVRARVGHKPAGFTNAIMRRIAAHDLDGWMDALDATQAVRRSHPDWIVEALSRALDRPDELDALLTADNERPGVTLVARPGLSTVEELGGQPLAISPLAAVMDSGDPGAVPAVREGRAGVQDAGSQLVALALTRAVVDGRDERWLDLCAGPGGKAALLGAVATERGARLLASERLPHRAKLVAQAIRATQGDVVTGDGTRPPMARRDVRPRPRRRTLLGTRGAPATPGEPLAAHRAGSGGAGPAAAGVAAQRARLCATGGSGALRDLLTGGRGVERRGRRGARRQAGRTARGAALDGPGGRGRGVRPPRGGRPALAAPARHRRDVHGPPPPGVSSGNGDAGCARQRHG